MLARHPSRAHREGVERSCKVTRSDSRKALFAQFTDEQVQAEYERLSRIASEAHSASAKTLAELRRRNKIKQRAQSAKDKYNEA